MLTTFQKIAALIQTMTYEELDLFVCMLSDESCNHGDMIDSDVVRASLAAWAHTGSIKRK